MGQWLGITDSWPPSGLGLGSKTQVSEGRSALCVSRSLLMVVAEEPGGKLLRSSLDGPRYHSPCISRGRASVSGVGRVSDKVTGHRMWLGARWSSENKAASGKVASRGWEPGCSFLSLFFSPFMRGREGGFRSFIVKHQTCILKAKVHLKTYICDINITKPWPHHSCKYIW